ncbi:putative thiamine transport system permease protein [Aeromonas sp. BIGb0405]|uniref:ABC transporter permease n=1 Tax=unclassified Aeromonas TaxID=257493 RepID=UPI002168C2AA|nr:MULTISPECIES: ABC transporter permease [unclassified Aeromonas]MCS3454369.1 putative thiamine transport system permease protein [Aeromonas sp. BIGb0405]MCS3459323.1 putative thiamine transport system permease protein [Aeromonas sp. BIGb0445]
MRHLILPLTAALLWLPLIAGLLVLLVQARDPEPWLRLWAQPGLGESIWLSLWIASASSLLSLLLVALLLAHSENRSFALLRRLLAPLLAMPHVAFAIGFGFLIAPSGWLLRLVSPGLTGLSLPPDWQTLHDPWGLGLIAMLVLKETPFLLLMALGALDPRLLARQQWLGQSLGFRPAQIWWRLILPSLWPSLRLPLYAVAAYGLAVVDLGLLLGPTQPAPLAVRLWRWYQDADLGWRALANNGALLLFGLNLLLLGALRALEGLHLHGGKGWMLNGQRQRAAARLAPALSATLTALLLALNLLVLAALLLWSFTRRWSFPAPWPSQWSGHHWQQAIGDIAQPLAHSTWLALSTAIVALILVVFALEAQRGRRPWPLWLVCLPLLLPQASLLLGARLGADWLGLPVGSALVFWSQLLFVYPYLYLCLYGPYRQFDDRLAQAAATLGANPWQVWWRVKGPLLLRPLAFACAVGAAVSLAQYLPTLLFGAGRITTITTEAVAIGSGLNRRLASLYGLLQLTLPLLIYALALRLPRRSNPMETTP